MKKIAVLGSGLVGSLMAKELAADGRFEVTAYDRSEEALGALAGLPRLRTARADFASAGEIARAAEAADVVVGSVPGHLGHAMLKTVIEARKPVADISFAPEDPFVHDALAKRNAVPAIVDCGVSPGLSNLAIGRAESLLENTDAIRILVGGLPFRRVKPFEYRSVFSPTDVLEEYTRPARIRENGRTVVRPALSEVEEVDLPVVGTLEAFNSDGLRTLLVTSRAANVCEKTLRYPGHAALMRAFRDAGFFGDAPVDAGGASVVPRALTEALFVASWRRPPEEEEFTILSVTCRGTRRGRPEVRRYDLFDRTDPKTGATSMARTTGFPCVLAAAMLADGTWGRPGVHPPEILGREPAVWDAMVAGLAARGVSFTESVAAEAG
jgi:saccharopine dehydrogenase-like NADP-dependent oxidoreductase